MCFEILICPRRAKNNFKNNRDTDLFGSLEILKKGGCLALKIHVNSGRNIVFLSKHSSIYFQPWANSLNINQNKQDSDSKTATDGVSSLPWHKINSFYRVIDSCHRISTSTVWNVIHRLSPAILSLKARLNGFNIWLNMRSTQLLNQISGAFEQVVQHC